MADEKTVDLRIDASQGAQALNQVEAAAEGAADAMGDLAGAVQKTEENVKRIVTASRDYNNAARQVGDSVQSITRFEAAYKASLNDTANSAQVRAQILAASFSHTIGGAADEAKAIQLAAAGHIQAAEAVRFMLANAAPLPGALNGVAAGAVHAARGHNQFQTAVQQAGYQIADVAAVAAAGGNAMMTAGTQLGQFLGVFGPMGAIAGAAVTVLGLLATNMLKVGEASDKAAKAEDAFSDALSKANELTKTSIELTRQKAGAARESAAASLAEQQAALTTQFMDQGQKVAGLRARDEKFLPGYQSTELATAEAELERVYQRLRDIAQAKSDLAKSAPQRLADTVITSGQPKAELEAKRDELQAGVTAAAARGDTEALARLTEAYGAVNRAIATYKTEGEKAVLLAEAQAKASTMGAVEGQRYLAQRQAEIGLMGKIIEQGEAENTLAAARISANSAAAKSYADSQAAITIAAVETQTRLAFIALDGERQALAQRRELGEISAAEELAQLIEIEDRKRAVEIDVAERKLALLRKSDADNIAAIDAAERAITELRAKHALDREKLLDQEANARRRQARELAQIEAEAAAAQGGASAASRTEEVRFQRSIGQIDGSQEIAALRQIADEKYRVERELLDRKMELAGAEATERARIANQMVALDEKRAADMARLDRQATLERLENIRAVTAPFTQATSMMTQGFIQGTLTKQQMAWRAAQSIAMAYANMGIKVATDWFNTNVAMAAIDRMFGTAKVATAAAVEGQRTGATAAGAAARNAIGATEGDGFFSRLWSMVAGWLGLETAKTAETTIGTGTRTIALGAEATAAIMASKAIAAAAIPAQAGIGAAAAMASVAAIPVVGWAMAPGVGAQHAATAMSFLGLASAERGWGEVPEDGVMTELHKKEMVLPAQFAVPLRAMLTGSGPAMPSYGLPPGLGRLSGDGFKAMSQNSPSARGGDIHVSVINHNKGKLTTADIADFTEETCKALNKGLSNGNSHALAFKGKK